MRCAVLTSSISRLAGGLFISTRQLTRQLETLGVEMAVWGVSDPHSDIDRQAWGGLTVNLFDSRGPRAFAYAPAYRSRLEAFAPDLVHCHGIWQYPSVACATWARHTQRPYIVSPRGMLDPWALAHSGIKKRIAAVGFQRRHLQEAACLHALCESEAASMRAYGLVNPIAVVPNGVDLPTETHTLPPPWNTDLTKGRRILLFLGRLHPKKGLPHLLEGWSALLQVQPELADQWCLVLAGWDDGGHLAALERQVAELKLHTSVLLPGPLHGNAKQAAFAHADAFVLPSFSEGMPMAVLEAWAAGLPVLMTAACNIPQGTGSGAAIEMPADATGARHGLGCITALSADDRHTMGRRGRELVEQRFTWEVVARQMYETYEWMLGAGGMPACVQTT